MAQAVLFPTQMFQPRMVDVAFSDQQSAALAAGFTSALINQDALEAGNVALSVSGIEYEGAAIYRGSMLRVEQYESLFAGLAAKGIELINSPAAYKHAHHMPESFELIRAHSPKTLWLALGKQGIDLNALSVAADAFGDAPVVVKDYVKSRKHEWNEACFVPAASDKEKLARVVSTFIERQGDMLTGGVVLREFIELDQVGTHPKSGMPLTREYRVFVLDGEPLCTLRYWPEAEYDDIELPLDHFGEVMRSVESRLFTIDIARDKKGQWWIIELGDGQVAGLLDGVGEAEFYTRLGERLAVLSSPVMIRLDRP